MRVIGSYIGYRKRGQRKRGGLHLNYVHICDRFWAERQELSGGVFESKVKVRTHPGTVYRGRRVCSVYELLSVVGKELTY